MRQGSFRSDNLICIGISKLSGSEDSQELEQSTMTFDQLAEKASREQLREIQWQKLRELLRFVSARNPFYTKKWREAGIAPQEIRSLSDLSKLPFTHKSELVTAQEEALPSVRTPLFPQKPMCACIKLPERRELPCVSWTLPRAGNGGADAGDTCFVARA